MVAPPTGDGNDAAYACLYPDVLRKFQAWQGILVQFVHLPAINAYAARRDALSTTVSNALIPERARKPDMHLLYDLSNADFGGELLTRIEMMSADASRLRSGQALRDCLDQLYSTTTDLLGLILTFRTAGGATSPPADKLAIIDHDLRVIQQKHLITTARLNYFRGTLFGAGAAIFLALVTFWVQTMGHAFFPPFFDLGPALYLAWLFGTAGATLSVVQRISSGRLDLRYDVGNGYTFLLGFLRPWIGAFGGLLFWVLVQGRVILNPTISPYYLAALAFGFGIAERTLGDVATKTGITAIPVRFAAAGGERSMTATAAGRARPGTSDAGGDGARSRQRRRPRSGGAGKRSAES